MGVLLDQRAKGHSWPSLHRKFQGRTLLAVRGSKPLDGALARGLAPSDWQGLGCGHPCDQSQGAATDNHQDHQVGAEEELPEKVEKKSRKKKDVTWFPLNLLSII